MCLILCLVIAWKMNALVIINIKILIKMLSNVNDKKKIDHWLTILKVNTPSLNWYFFFFLCFALLWKWNEIKWPEKKRLGLNVIYHLPISTDQWNERKRSKIWLYISAWICISTSSRCSFGINKPTCFCMSETKMAASILIQQSKRVITVSFCTQQT